MFVLSSCSASAILAVVSSHRRLLRQERHRQELLDSALAEKVRSLNRDYRRLVNQKWKLINKLSEFEAKEDIRAQRLSQAANGSFASSSSSPLKDGKRDHSEEEHGDSEAEDNTRGLSSSSPSRSLPSGDSYPADIEAEARRRVRRRLERLVATDGGVHKSTPEGKLEAISRVTPLELRRLHAAEVSRVVFDAISADERDRERLEGQTKQLVGLAKLRLLEGTKAVTLEEEGKRVRLQKEEEQKQREEEIGRFQEETGLSAETVQQLLSLQPQEFSPEARRVRQEIEEEARRRVEKESALYAKQSLQREVSSLAASLSSKKPELETQMRLLSEASAESAVESQRVSESVQTVDATKREIKNVELSLEKLQRTSMETAADGAAKMQSLNQDEKELNAEYVANVKQIEFGMTEKDVKMSDFVRAKREKSDLEEIFHRESGESATHQKSEEEQIRIVEAEISRAAKANESLRAELQSIENATKEARKRASWDRTTFETKVLRRKLEMDLCQPLLTRSLGCSQAYRERLQRRNDAFKDRLDSASAELKTQVDGESSAFKRLDKQFAAEIGEVVELKTARSKLKFRKEELPSLAGEVQKAKDTLAEKQKSVAVRIGQEEKRIDEIQGDRLSIVEDSKILSWEIALLREAANRSSLDIEKEIDELTKEIADISTTK